MTTVNSGLPSTSVWDMRRAPNGDLWFATSQGAARFDGADWTTYTTADGLVSNQVRAIDVHPAGDVWLGTIVGVNRFDGSAFETYTGIGDDDIRTITVDGAGNVWAGTRNTGVGRFDGIQWKIFGVDDGLVFGRVISTAVDPGGPVWVGTEFGVSIYLGPLPGAPGSVPDGAGVAGPPLRVSKGPGANKLTLEWEAGCSGDATDYAVYRGDLGDFDSHLPLDCATGGLSKSINTQPGDAYYLVTARTPGAEGSYGTLSSGAERPPSTAACGAPLLSICL